MTRSNRSLGPTSPPTSIWAPDRPQILARGLGDWPRTREAPSKARRRPARVMRSGRGVDRDPAGGEAEAALARAQRDIEVEPGAKRDALDRPGAAPGAPAEPDGDARPRCDPPGPRRRCAARPRRPRHRMRPSGPAAGRCCRRGQAGRTARSNGRSGAEASGIDEPAWRPSARRSPSPAPSGLLQCPDSCPASAGPIRPAAVRKRFERCGREQACERAQRGQGERRRATSPATAARRQGRRPGRGRASAGARRPNWRARGEEAANAVSFRHCARMSSKSRGSLDPHGRSPLLMVKRG